MAFTLADRVLQTGTANTTVSFTLNGSVTGYQSFAVIGDTNTTYYSATDGTNWETGIGTYSTTGPTLTRTTVSQSSNSNTAVTFSGTVTVWVEYPSSYSVRAAGSGSNSEFAATTAILFQQTAAPTGWTKSTTHNNKALRVVSGSVSSGGTVAFTTAFTSQAVSGTNTGTAITTAQMPAHNHGISDPGHNHTLNDPGHAHSVYDPGHSHGLYQGYYTGTGNYTPPGQDAGLGINAATNGSYSGIGIYGAGTGTYNSAAVTGISTSNNGSGATHTHTFSGTAIDLSVQYVDAIICTKD